ncbi:N-acetylmannosamine-6-phosphate 2-epimerase [Vibrio nigripulchritudo]|uniref:N-acetylmannosamine-6-phosphate 2-epimerase n=1 Tax=Vibrio nigripulchritudo TaxID=28173 RepID=UPI00248FC0AF|nr:N-acetylmannosamine-6-phosphate 2-epimerase [Vibrio nigripulchritudo]BDU40379.1 putative N-acetylmannosamine-6-phosphate 2-epimerase [Vibrio nigripulchritudo]BDU46115.1 putative N-acetylmannosamine-6-phosphate 2-epimerase [Vibrio nigripulchritudo]
MKKYHMDAVPVIDALHGGLVVSCQPVEDSPMDKDDIVLAYAKTAILSGAKGLRIEGVRRTEFVRKYVDTPIIGIVKRDFEQYPVRITAMKEDVIGLINAGADIIAIDATFRQRPEPFADLVSLVKSQGKCVMADCSTFEEGMVAAELGCDLIGSTLSGYTTEVVPKDPDFNLVEQWVAQGLRVMAEGRYNTPDAVSRVLASGAWSCTVGTAITRPELVTEWFVDHAKLGHERHLDQQVITK